MTNLVLATVLGAVISYLLGGFPSGVVIGKGIYGIDVREHGSCNMGMTNTIRVLGIKPGLAVAAIDVLKGCAGVLVMRALLIHVAPALDGNVHDLLLVIAALAAVLGHVKSPYLHFSGGKGAATAFGVLVVLMPWPALVVLAVFLAVALGTKIVSLATLSAAVALVVSTPLLMPGHPVLLGFSVIVLVIIFAAHRSNIARLRNHSEKKLTSGHAKTKHQREKESTREGE